MGTVHTKKHQSPETACAHAGKYAERERNGRSQVTLDHPGVVVEPRALEGLDHDRSDRMNEDVDRTAALRFRDHGRGTRGIAQIRTDGDDSRVDGPHEFQRRLRRGAAGPKGERDAVAGAGERQADALRQTARASRYECHPMGRGRIHDLRGHGQSVRQPCVADLLGRSIRQPVVTATACMHGRTGRRGNTAAHRIERNSPPAQGPFWGLARYTDLPRRGIRGQRRGPRLQALSAGSGRRA